MGASGPRGSAAVRLLPALEFFPGLVLYQARCTAERREIIFFLLAIDMADLQDWLLFQPVLVGLMPDSR